MVGDKEMETPHSALDRLTGWAVIIGLCVLFWLAVYNLLISWRAAY